jgi:hypothetical protein
MCVVVVLFSEGVKKKYCLQNKKKEKNNTNVERGVRIVCRREKKKNLRSLPDGKHGNFFKK